MVCSVAASERSTLCRLIADVSARIHLTVALNVDSRGAGKPEETLQNNIRNRSVQLGEEVKQDATTPEI